MFTTVPQNVTSLQNFINNEFYYCGRYALLSVPSSCKYPCLVMFCRGQLKIRMLVLTNIVHAQPTIIYVLFVCYVLYVMNFVFIPFDEGSVHSCVRCVHCPCSVGYTCSVW